VLLLCEVPQFVAELRRGDIDERVDALADAAGNRSATPYSVTT
jgi:hypothetical protein